MQTNKTIKPNSTRKIMTLTNTLK